MLKSLWIKFLVLLLAVSLIALSSALVTEGTDDKRFCKGMLRGGEMEDNRVTG